MDSAENAIEENRRLRRTTRDLVALSTLPAVWTGLDVEGSPAVHVAKIAADWYNKCRDLLLISPIFAFTDEVAR